MGGEVAGPEGQATFERCNTGVGTLQLEFHGPKFLSEYFFNILVGLILILKFSFKDKYNGLINSLIILWEK